MEVDILSFVIDKKDKNCSARAGTIKTTHGIIETPIFMPVGTVGSVKTLTPDELYEIGATIILGNTYHLHLRPGEEIVAHFGGLHRFMNWQRNILTDSGGFQVFSLADLNKITEDGVEFKSHIDGSRHFFSPEISMEIQKKLGSDIVMAFDECVPYPSEKSYVAKSLERTTRWAKRCKEYTLDNHQSLFGIVQGGVFKDLRKISADQLIDLDFPGYAIGGLSVGEEIPLMYEIAEYTAHLLPEEKPRYLMGVGTPEDILNGISFGIDMFDCVMPTRNARNALLFTSEGRLSIKRADLAKSDDPIDKNCGCYTCRNFSRGYLRHLYKAGEILAMRLNTIHNLHFYISLVKSARNAIINGNFEKFKSDMLLKLNQGGNNV
ncbi:MULTISPECIES: tRNA guanosine(34) transglycosylase Tgt [Calditerrivibrio]|uniref:tRNA guanosine(34) transglycosylase Tgt n=1 Tax=Calditerrivibrio TaxID=545865 RepID=UPI003C773A53